MEWVETTGKSIEEALDRALDQLGVDDQDLEYEVIAEPKQGLFGRIKSEGRIRARVKPLSREKPTERRPRRKARTADKKRATKGADAGRRPASSSDSSRGTSKRRRRRRSGGGSPPPERTEGNTVENQIGVEEQADLAVEFARGLVEAFGAKAEVEGTVEDEDNVLVEVVGDDLGLLVGQKGATLAAVEELVRTVVQRGTGGGSARIHVDVGGYRAKRREALAAFTEKVADQVLDTGSDTALEPMSPADRKVVHDTVSEIDGVETLSEGEEPRRRVVIRRA